MDSNNDKLKQIFSEGGPDLPPAFGWEQMEEGIMEKMEALDTAEPLSPRTNTKAIRITVILILCLVPVLFFNNGWLLEMAGFQSQGSTSKGQVKTTERATDHSPAAQPLVLNTDPLPQAVSEESGPTTAPSKQAANEQPRPEGRQEAFSDGQGKPARVPQDAEQSKMAEDIFMPEPPVAADKLPADAPEAPNLLSPANTPVLSSANMPIGTTENQQAQVSLALLQSLPFKALRPQQPIHIANASAEQAALPEQDRRLIPAQQWSVLSGVSNWAPKYGDTPPENAPYEQTALSYYTQLSYTHRIGNNYTLTVGLQYQQLETQLAWSQRIEDYTTVTLTDTIVEIQVSSLTGNSSEVRGDVEVSVDAIRNVRHHNQYRLIQVPVAVGKSWRLGNRWQASLAAGAAINVLAHNQGRSIYQGELQLVNGPTTPTMDNRWGLHGLAMARMGYRLNERMGILLDMQYQRSLTNWSSAPNLRMQPRIFNLGLGAYYAL